VMLKKSGAKRKLSHLAQEAPAARLGRAVNVAQQRRSPVTAASRALANVGVYDDME